MLLRTEQTSTTGRKPAAIPQAGASRARTRRRLLADRVARRVVTFGGMAIIGSILAILVVIALEVWPLFRDPSAEALPPTATGVEAPLALGVDEYREVAYLVTERGLGFVSLRGEAVFPDFAIPDLGSARVTAHSPLGRGPFALGLSDGRVVPMEVRFRASFEGVRRTIIPEPEASTPIRVLPEGRPVTRLAYVVTPSGPAVATLDGPRRVVLSRVRETRALIGEGKREEVVSSFAIPDGAEACALALDGRGEDLFIGTTTGRVLLLDLRGDGDPALSDSLQVTPRPEVKVSTLDFLLGDRTVVVGDVGGGVSAWQLMNAESGGRTLQFLRRFTGHTAPVAIMAPSTRDKGFLTADTAGGVLLHYGTTGKTLLSLRSGENELRGLAFAPKADGILTADAMGRIAHWALRNPHPEVSLRTIFGKTHYEGYSEPEHVWQSTGGTDDFEAKLSLTPLIFGTLKGTFYALLFAIPLSLLGALYASQFMSPGLKAVVKPIVEIMAALPSVVLGFIAGLWLAPQVEQVVPGLFILPLLVTAFVMVALVLWQKVPAAFRRRLGGGSEVFLLVPVVLLAGWVSFHLGSLLEAGLLSGDYRGWLLETLGLTYDQRNSLVVGFAMGFAVVPIIFTIAEDSLSNVPRHLAAGSLALGATRWQTALRVVLPTASPGIFSAIMIGFGRAVGETMIVLMATGNTPVMDWSMFNGFRALSANIAVELPEAPEGGTLYRVLFLAALLLFAMTFLVNTAAELVRLRLRQRYRVL